jgi:hypothetical protein
MAARKEYDIGPARQNGTGILGRRQLRLFVSASGSFLPPKAATNCQTLSFSDSFYKIRFSKNHPKST